MALANVERCRKGAPLQRGVVQTSERIGEEEEVGDAPVISVAVPARPFALPVTVLIVRVRVPPLSACASRQFWAVASAHIDFSNDVETTLMRGVARMQARRSQTYGNHGHRRPGCKVQTSLQQ